MLNSKGTEVRIWGFSTWMARVVSEASHGACFDTRSAQSTSNMPTCDGNLLDWFCRVLGARLRSTFRRGSRPGCFRSIGAARYGKDLFLAAACGAW